MELADLMTPSEATGAAQSLISRWPNGKPDDPKAYIGGLALALGQYPRSIVVGCIDPRIGVARDTEFMPTIAKVSAWCDKAIADLQFWIAAEHRQFEYEASARRQIEERGAPARAARPSYGELQARHGPRWGMEEASSGEQARAANLAAIERANRVLFERECAAAGIDPAGMASPELAAKLNPQKQEQTT
jgi:hypothetical protein